MPVASQEEQFKFLISCIRYSNNGKVDFTEVAKECQIVSKGAAAKRYERMMKYHGLYQPASGARETFKPIDTKEQKSPDPTPSVTKGTKNTNKSPSSSPSKKPRQSYKGFDGGNCDIAVDDDEGLIPIGPGAVKAEKVAPNTVKEEFEAYRGMAGLQYPLMDGGGGRAMDDCTDALSEFLQSEDFEQQHGPGKDASDVFGNGYCGI